jgi:hypothetical protein
VPGWACKAGVPRDGFVCVNLSAFGQAAARWTPVSAACPRFTT